MKGFETVLLRLSKSDDDSSLNDTAKSLLNADLESVICSEFASNVFGTCLKKAELFEKDVVKRNIDALPNDESTFQELLILGVACLLAFVQLEWTGPPLEEFVECAQESSSSATNAEALSCDGETLMSGVTCPHLLLAANAVLSHSAIDTFYPSRSWWHARCLFVHQQVLSGAAASLRDALEQQLLLAHTTFGLFDDQRVKELLGMSVADSGTAAATSVSNNNNNNDNNNNISSAETKDELNKSADDSKSNTNNNDEKDDDDELVAFIERMQALDVRNDASSVDERWAGPNAIIEALPFSRPDADQAHRDLAACLYLERSHILTYYRYDRRAVLAICAARRAAELTIQMSGAAGRRTVFQNFDIAQLQLVATPRNASADIELQSISDADTTNEGPALVPLDDDVRLDAVKFTEKYRIAPLNALERSIVLAYGRAAGRIGARQDTLSSEEERAYVDRVLAPTNEPDWTVYSAALYGRAKLDTTHHRRAERGALQLQALVDQWALKSNDNCDDESKVDVKATAAARLSNLFVSALPLRRRLRIATAKAMMRIGAARTAQEEFERLEEWELVMQCLTIAGDASKAEQVCRERLAAQPSPRLWLTLGQLLSDGDEARQCYETAWQLSNGRLAAAQRALAQSAVREERWSDVVRHYDLALAVNRLHAGSWFSSGCAHMRLEQFDRAVTAFRNAVQQAPDDAETWANLGAVLLKSHRKRPAFHAMSVAVRHSPQNWRMWQNLQYVAMDVGELPTVLRAARRLIDLDLAGNSTQRVSLGAVVDFELLELLSRVSAARRDALATDADADTPLFESTQLFVCQVLAVLRYAASKMTADYRLWSLLGTHYERVAPSTAPVQQRVVCLTRAVDARQRALRSAEASLKDWQRDGAHYAVVAQCALDVARAYLALNELDTSNPPTTAAVAPASAANSTSGARRDWFSELELSPVDLPPLSSARLKLSALVRRGKELFSQTKEYAQLQPTIEQLKNIKK